MINDRIFQSTSILFLYLWEFPGGGETNVGSYSSEQSETDVIIARANWGNCSLAREGSDEYSRGPFPLCDASTDDVKGRVREPACVRCKGGAGLSGLSPR